MKYRTHLAKTAYLLFAMLWIMPTNAQTVDRPPEAINFQAIARDIHGNILDNSAIRVRIILIDKKETPVEVFREIHEVRSNTFGLINLQIGNGEEEAGKFEEINWADGEYWLKMSMAVEAEEMRAVIETQLVSVPYALHAKTAERLSGGMRELSDSVWLIGGNIGTSANLNYIGTGDFEDLVLKTDGTERMRLKAQGQIGIGTTSPSTSLEIFGDIRVGDGSNYGQINAVGDLFFKGTGDYLVGPNRYAFRYQFQEDYGLMFNALDFRYEFLTAGQNRVFSVHANNGKTFIAGRLGIGTTMPNAKLDVMGDASIGATGTDYAFFATDGDLTFVGNADYLVRGNRYAFRYFADQNFGLYFNASNGSYQFMDGTASPVFSVKAINGETHVAGNLGVGTTLPSTKLDVAGTITTTGFTMPVNAIAGFVLTSDAFGVASWQPSGGIGGSDNDWFISGNNMYSGVSERVGIGTNLPLSKLHVSDTSGVLFEGQFGIGSIPVEGPGTRLMWYPGKAAFRAGRAAANEWDDVNIGFSSVAYGFATQASGNNAVAMGSVTIASGSNSTAMGNFSVASGSAATAMGWNSVASGEFATVMGQNTQASGKNSLSIGAGSSAEALNSVAFGLNTVANGTNSTALGSFTTSFGNSALSLGHNSYARAYASLVIGQYNIISGDSGIWLAVDPVFVIGNGLSTVNRSNAVTVLKDGRFGIGISTPSELLDVNGGIKIGNTTGASAGSMRFTGTDFEGHTGGTWVSLTGGGAGAPDQSLSLTGTNLNISGSGGNTVNLVSLIDDADADSTNEIQDLVYTGNNLSVSGGTNIVDLTTYLDNTDAQNLSFNGSDLSISNGNQVNLTSLINDNDADPTNEIQGISLSGINLSISGSGSSVDLSSFFDNTDAQTLSFTGSQLDISGGNSVNLSGLINDADSDPINELQDISISGNDVNITGSTSSINLSPYLDNTDNQILSVSGNSLSISNGNTVALPVSGGGQNQTLSFVGNNLTISGPGGNTVSLNSLINDADFDPVNELQDLSLAANSLSLSGSVPTIDLSSYLDNTDNQTLSIFGNSLSISNGNSVVLSSSSLWTASGNDIYVNNGGNVGIGTTNPIYSLDVNGGFQVSQLAVFQALSVFSGDAVFTANVGIGTIFPMEKLHVFGNAIIQGNLCYTGIIGTCSDLRYKRNVTEIDNALDGLMSFDGVYYDWKLDEFPDMGFSERKQIGVIAQEVENTFPELVMTDNEGYKSVDYTKFTPILIEALQEQQEMIEALQKENVEMRMRLDKLEGFSANSK